MLKQGSGAFFVFQREAKLYSNSLSQETDEGLTFLCADNGYLDEKVRVNRITATLILLLN